MSRREHTIDGTTRGALAAHHRLSAVARRAGALRGIGMIPFTPSAGLFRQARPAKHGISHENDNPILAFPNVTIWQDSAPQILQLANGRGTLDAWFYVSAMDIMELAGPDTFFRQLRRLILECDLMRTITRYWHFPISVTSRWCQKSSAWSMQQVCSRYHTIWITPSWTRGTIFSNGFVTNMVNSHGRG